jgi:hypothetical protein
MSTSQPTFPLSDKKLLHINVYKYNKSLNYSASLNKSSDTAKRSEYTIDKGVNTTEEVKKDQALYNRFIRTSDKNNNKIIELSIDDSVRNEERGTLDNIDLLDTIYKTHTKDHFRKFQNVKTRNESMKRNTWVSASQQFSYTVTDNSKIDRSKILEKDKSEREENLTEKETTKQNQIEIIHTNMENGEIIIKEIKNENGENRHNSNEEEEEDEEEEEEEEESTVNREIIEYSMRDKIEFKMDDIPPQQCSPDFYANKKTRPKEQEEENDTRRHRKNKTQLEKRSISVVTFNDISQIKKENTVLINNISFPNNSIKNYSDEEIENQSALETIKKDDKLITSEITQSKAGKNALFKKAVSNKDMKFINNSNQISNIHQQGVHSVMINPTSLGTKELNLSKISKIPKKLNQDTTTFQIENTSLNNNGDAQIYQNECENCENMRREVVKLRKEKMDMKIESSNLKKEISKMKLEMEKMNKTLEQKDKVYEKETEYMKRQEKEINRLNSMLDRVKKQLQYSTKTGMNENELFNLIRKGNVIKIRDDNPTLEIPESSEEGRK